MFKKHLPKYKLDTIAYYKDPTDSTMMISLFTNYPKFSVKEVKKQNLTYDFMYNAYNKQNYKEVIKCFLNLLKIPNCVRT